MSDIRDGFVYLRGMKSKNGRPYRVPLGFLPELDQLIEYRRQVKMLSPYVFHIDGEQIEEFRADWRDACAAIDYPGFIFHDLRRSAARNLIRAGVDPETVMLIGGWRTSAMLSRYNITSEGDLEDAFSKLAAYSEKQSKKVVAIAG